MPTVSLGTHGASAPRDLHFRSDGEYALPVYLVLVRETGYAYVEHYQRGMLPTASVDREEWFLLPGVPTPVEVNALLASVAELLQRELDEPGTGAEFIEVERSELVFQTKFMTARQNQEYARFVDKDGNECDEGEQSWWISSDGSVKIDRRTTNTRASSVKPESLDSHGR